MDLLLGTDTLPKLGITLVQTDDTTDSTDLLQPSKRDLATLPPDHNGPSPDPLVQGKEETRAQEHGVITVKLIHATRLPGRHSKLVRVNHGMTEAPSQTCIFEPELQNLQQKGLSMADALVEPGDRMTLLITNRGAEPVQLEVGEVVGRLQPARVVEMQGVVGEEGRGAGDSGMVMEVTDGGVRVEDVVVTERTTGQDQDLPKCVAAISQVDGRVDEDDRERKRKLLDALHIEGTALPEDHRQLLMELVFEFANLFALDSSELGHTSTVTHRIDTGEHPPVKQAPRRVPFALREKVCQLVREMLEQGVIKPSSSPWASPIVLVTKKDGSTRFCVDYRRLNSLTKMDVYPLPRIDDSLDLLAETQFFSSLDLASGYWQVGMDEESQEKTAFATHAGLYEFTVMPFGLCNAPATFQRLMENVLAGLARDKCIIYLDDILVIGRTLQEHMENLRLVFTRLRQAGLKLKPSKCKLMQREVQFLGYVVSSGGISGDPQKITAVKEFPRPVDLKSLRAFLGLTSYYRRFVPRFSAVAQPLYNLTKKDALFEWTVECEEAFQRLKDLLTKAPVLAYPQFGQRFLLETDASGVGLGAVLSQQQPDKTIRPIAFASRTLQQHERNYGISELEALGVVWAVKHFRHYLYGHPCTVYTDHEALKSLLNTPQPSGKLARWGMAIQELDLAIEYRPGNSNARADALSRYPQSLLDSPLGKTCADTVVAAIQAQEISAKSGEEDSLDTLAERQQADPTLNPVITYLETGELPSDDRLARELVLSRDLYSLEDGVLYRVMPDKTRRVIPPTQDRRDLFMEAHQGVFGAHLRGAKIHSQLQRHYWWPGMRAEVKNWCRACLVCASRSVGRPERPPLTPIPVAGPFDRVGVDVLKLPRSRRGHSYAVVFVDYLTKWPEVYATRDQTAPTIAKLLVEEVISRHGVPNQLLSDRGPSFLSHLITEVCRLMGIKKVNTTAYHPQGDGLVERFNRTLLDMLAKTVKPGGQDWDERLPYVLFAYRATLQASTAESPFFLLYGRDPQLPTDAALCPPVERSTVRTDDYGSSLVQFMSDAWKLARTSIEKAQSRQKRQHDKRARSIPLKVGQRVFVHVPSLKTGPAHKLARPFKGPYRVVALHPNGADLKSVDHPRANTIRVALNRVRICPSQIGEEMQPESEPLEQESHAREVYSPPLDAEMEEPEETEHPADTGTDPQDSGTTLWSGRLRPRTRTS